MPVATRGSWRGQHTRPVGEPSIHALRLKTFFLAQQCSFDNRSFRKSFSSRRRETESSPIYRLSVSFIIKRIDELAERYIDCLVSREEIERKEEMCGDRYRPKISKAGNDRHLKGSLIATSRHFRSLPFPLDFYSAFYSTASLYLPPTLFVIIKLALIVLPLKFALPAHSNRIFEIFQFS